MQKSKKKKTNTIVLFLLIVIITIIVLLLNAFSHHNKKITTITSDKALQLSKYSNNNVNVIQDPLVLWSSDFHIATIADIKHFLSNKNVKIIDKVN